MKDRHLCCPPYFFLGPSVAPHFFISRIATGQVHSTRYPDRPTIQSEVNERCSYMVHRSTDSA